MTKEESMAWRHWSTTYKMQGISDEQKNRRIKISLQKGWMTEDESILNLLENGIDEFEKRVAIRIDEQNDIDYNNCPNCGKLTRTPKAKQCRFCGNGWH